MATIQFYNLGTQGIYKDIPPHLLAPEAWSEGQNMRMLDGYATRSLGFEQVFGTPSVAPGFVMNVPSASDIFWLYASLAAVYAYTGGVHTDITRAAGAYTAVNYRDWNGCILGGVPILNNGADVPQFWPTLTVVTDLANLTNWPATLRAKVIRNFGKYLVAFNLNDNGTLLPHAVRWSSAADPGSIPASWDYTNPAVDAGQTHLTDIHGGDILDAALLGSQLFIYKQHSTHAMRYIGGVDIFSFDKMFDAGAMNARCIAAIDQGRRHLILGDDNVFVHVGGRDLAYPIDARNQRYLYADIDGTNLVNAFVLDNPVFNEAWICYPSSGATFPNKKLVWNYQRDTIHFDDFLGLSADFGRFTDAIGTTWDTITGSWDSQANPWASITGRRRLIIGDPSNTKIWGQDSGYVFGSLSTTAYLQRIGLAIIGKDRQGQPKADYTSRKLFKRIWPKIRGTASVQVRLGSQEEIDGTVTWAPYQIYSPSQKYLDFTVNGRLGAVEMLSDNNLEWRVEGYDLEVELLGGH